MTDNYLITGYWGEPHVTAENDRGINAAIFGSGRFVLPVGKQFKAEYVGNNTIRLYDGKLLDNGAAAGIPAGMYVDFQIPGAGQGLKRNDVIAFQYTKDTSTFVESGKFVLISGTEISGTAADPVLTQNDLLTDEAVIDQMALWRIPVSGAVIGTPERMAPIHYAGDRVVTAHSTDGVTYTADVPGVIDLYNGMELTIIPDKGSTATAVKLNVNGTGDKLVRLPLSFNTAAMTTPDLTTFFVEGRPVKIMYDSEYAAGGIWKTVDKQKTSAQDLYGTLPIANGGTGATTANAAASNLCEYGTWTPKMQWATNTEKPTVTYQSQIGEYVRIGNIVHAWWKLRFKTSSGWTTNGDYLRIAGFPHVFANNNNQGFLGTIIVPGSTLSTSYYVQTYSGYSHVGVQSQNGSALKLTNSNIGDFYFYGQLTYKING